MPDWGIALTPAKTADVHFAAAPVPILLHAILLMNIVRADNNDALPGVTHTPRSIARALTAEQRTDLSMMYWLIGDHLLFDHQQLGFPEFLDTLEQLDAVALRDDAIGWMQHKEGFRGCEAVLSDFSAYEAIIQPVYEEKSELLGEYDRELHRQLWGLLQDPLSLKARIIRFLRFMWSQYLRDEWKHIQPTVVECVEAFRQQDYSRLTTAEIVEHVTLRDLQREEFFAKEIQNAKHITFIPTPYLGPYVTWMHDEASGRDLVFFGARQPRDISQRSAPLNRNELLIWLNALADETRLRMLEMLTREEEICAQDFITTLDLSQSSASRHLRQLTASGYLTERRRDVAKCYSLNRERVEETIRALQQLLA
jgi:DNA-binding transcriptional ArsR family regulator